MLIDLKVKTLDAQTHEFNIDNEITVREFKDKIAEKTSIAAEQQRIIYCGRVLADEKQLKEYDVNGKVVHVAERPPPSARGNAPPSPVSGDQPPRRTTRGMRNSPLFRALDGMVVGTMAIPMNAGVNNGQMQLNPFTSSSSFCMNRITVARHMLECANNIAAFLEDPSRGLNNSSLDILAQGRWTMESTVVEVGITAGDIPQEQNIVDMLEGAVSAALRRNGNTNVTVVQLPTVFGSSENPDGTHTSSETTAVVVEEPMEDALDDSADSAALNTSTTTEEMETANDDDVVITEEATIMPSSPSVSSGAGATAGTSSSTASVGSSGSGGASVSSSSSSTTGNTVEPNASSRRRTGTNVLADVIDQMRAIQTRLNPFVEQFYDMLRNEPTFEENDTVGRENAQRLYDRVSEAFHYMSHAQHAISDLLLDVSQPAPRYLACRPILVEQSGYVSSNNYLSAAAAAAAAGLGNLGGNGQGARQQPQQQQQQNQTPQQPTTAQAQDTAATSSTSTAANVDTAAGAPASAAAAENSTPIIEEPVDDPIVSPTVPAAIVEVNSSNGNASNNANHQMQVARLIQAVVNSAPIDTEFHVQINAPSIVSFGVPLNANAAAAAAAAAANANANTTETRQQQQQSGSNSANESQTNSNGNNSPTGSGNTSSPDGLHGESPNQTRSTTATLPTTATQTRSTSRPHVQMGNLVPAGGWNGRVIPANMMSSFDRFLPCNSHHVREPENANHANHANGNGTGGVTGTTAQLIPNTARVNQRTLRTITDLFRHVRPPPLVGATTLFGGSTRPTAAAASASAAAAVGQTSTSNTAASAGSGLATARNTATQPATAAATAVAPAAANAATGGSSSTSSSASTAASDLDTQRRIRLRVQLQNFISEHMFEGVPISDDSMMMAVNKTLRWIYDILIFLPQYDLPEYDSRDSIENLLRHTLPLIINLINGSQENPAQFEQRLTQLCGELFKRLFSILAVCAGRVNAEIYWCELMRTLVASLRTNFRGEALQFLQIYVNTKVPTATDTNDVQQFLVHRNIGEDTSGTDTDVEMVEPATTSQTNNYTFEDAENGEAMQLDSVVPGSEPWHSNFPVSWLPIISHDMQKQRELESKQTPYSDAYISGMSAKRRKMIQSSKPGSDLKSLLTDSVRNALQSAGVSNSSASNQSQTPDEITAAIANDTNVQASYSEALRTNVRERLKNDADYKPEKFPQTSKFLNK